MKKGKKKCELQYTGKYQKPMWEKYLHDVQQYLGGGQTDAVGPCDIRSQHLPPHTHCCRRNSIYLPTSYPTAMEMLQERKKMPQSALHLDGLRSQSERENMDMEHIQMCLQV